MKGPDHSGAYVEVLGVNIAVLGEVVVLFGDEYTFLEDVLVDEFPIRFGNKPAGGQ